MEHAQRKTISKRARSWHAFEANLRKLAKRAKDMPRSKDRSKSSSQKPAGSRDKTKARAVPENKEEALKALEERRNNPPKEIDNASLYAGSPMYYYCESCDHLADVLSESDFSTKPKKLCRFCTTLKDRGWLE